MVQDTHLDSVECVGRRFLWALEGESALSLTLHWEVTALLPHILIVSTFLCLTYLCFVFN